MRHSKSRFIEDARRVGTGAVKNRTYRRGENIHLFFLEFTLNLKQDVQVAPLLFSGHGLLRPSLTPSG